MPGDHVLEFTPCHVERKAQVPSGQPCTSPQPRTWGKRRRAASQNTVGAGNVWTESKTLGKGGPSSPVSLWLPIEFQ